jgi:predicted pyridoxine 5'-phosphate oxidase superfamily flavin-nucleotide-binding protein
MAVITAEVREAGDKVRIWAFVTADRNGNPNVVPIGTWRFRSDDTVIFMDNYLNKTKKNIFENPRVAFTFWDSESHKSFQLKGSAVIEASGKIFDEEVAKYKARRPNSNPHGVVIVKIDEIYITQGGPDAGKRIA